MRPLIKTKIPGPKARNIVKRSKRTGSNAIGREYPLVIKKAKGSNFWDVDGNRFLDFNSGVAVMNFGHSHPKITKGIEKQLKKMTHGAFLDFYEELPIKFSEELLDLFSDRYNMNRVFLSNSGTESIEAAIKLSRYNTGRGTMMAFQGAFHGRSMGSLSLTNSSNVHRKGFGPFLETVHIPFAHPYRCPLGASSENCVEECIQYVENVFRQEVNPEDVSALFVEFVQGEGGYIPANHEFMKYIYNKCQEHGIILVDDEIQAGCYRTGKFLAADHYRGIKPDIITMAKSIGGGLPLGATVYGERLDTWGPGAHASTFGGNLASCAAGLEVIDLMRDKKLENKVTEKGEYFRNFLRDLMKDNDLIGDVRGLGLMNAVEIVKNGNERAPKKRDRILEECFKKGLSLLHAGQNSIRFSPPLNIKKSDIDSGLKIFEDVVKSV